MNRKQKYRDALLGIGILIAIGSVALLVGICLTVIPVLSVIKAAKTTKWTLTKATIIQVQKGSSSSSRIGGARSGNSVHYDVPSIQYKYDFNGFKYDGRKVSYGLPWIGAERLGVVIAGDTVNVWVNPIDPRESILVQVSPAEGKVFYLIPCGLVFLLAGWCFLLGARKSFVSSVSL